MLDHEYEIKRNDDVVASISKKWFRVRDTYGVEIAAGEDEPLPLALTVGSGENCVRRESPRAGAPFEALLTGLLSVCATVSMRSRSERDEPQRAGSSARNPYRAAGGYGMASIVYCTSTVPLSGVLKWAVSTIGNVPV